MEIWKGKGRSVGFLSRKEVWVGYLGGVDGCERGAAEKGELVEDVGGGEGESWGVSRLF